MFDVTNVKMRKKNNNIYLFGCSRLLEIHCTLVCLQSAVKFSKAFGLRGFNRESMQVRELFQNLELRYLSVMLQAIALKFKQNAELPYPCAH